MIGTSAHGDRRRWRSRAGAGSRLSRRTLSSVPEDGWTHGVNEEPGAINVAGLLASGGALLQPVHVPNPEATIAGVEIFDPSREEDLTDGSLLLGVGVEPGSREAARLIEAADAAGVVGIAVMGTPPEVAAALPPGEIELALLAITPGAAWAQVHDVVRALTTTVAAARDLATPYQDLFAIANAVAAAVGGPTTIEDAEGQLLAFSSPQDPIDERRRETILGRGMPDQYQLDLRSAGIFRRLISSGEPLLLEADPQEGLRARLAIAVTAGAELLGYLWISEGERTLDGRAKQALRDVAPAVALHLLRVITVGNAERNQRRDLVAAALDGTWSDEIAAELDVRRGESVAVATIAPVVDGAAAEASFLSDRACEIIELHLSTFRFRGTVGRRGARVHCILPVGRAETGHHARAFVEEVVEKLELSLRAPFRAGIGSPGPVHRLRQAAEDAATALRAAQVLETEERCIQIADVRDRSLLVALRDQPRLQPLIRRGSVARIREWDRVEGTTYAETLAAYLDCQCSIPAAARQMHVHANTLRYRMAKLADLFGIDLEDPHERLALSLQFWLLDDEVEEEDDDRS